MGRNVPPAIVPRAVARLAALCLLLALGLAGCMGGDDGGGGEDGAGGRLSEPPAPPQLGVTAEDEEAAEKLGFPATATRNTTRVGGGDVAADAAGVAAALYPATGDVDRPKAVVLVDQDDWATGIAASVLAGGPIGAPLLLSDGDDLPAVTQEVLERLDPAGSDLSKDAQVIRVGRDVARPEDFRTAVVEGDDAFARAAAIDRFMSAARGAPSNDVVLYSAEQAEWAMPAASWAARSGDAALPVKADSIPAPTRRALAAHESPNVYLLGPDKVISKGVADQLRKGRLARSVNRIAGPTPVDNAIAFARYRRGDFGWGVVVPGYNFAVVSPSRPLDAAAAAGLGTNGVFAPLLLSDQAESLPEPLENYLLSVQPGYEEDPGDAVYNRVWVIGDDKAISISQQAAIDRIAELVPVDRDEP
jgi:hypothetical protein